MKGKIEFDIHYNKMIKTFGKFNKVSFKLQVSITFQKVKSF